MTNIRNAMMAVSGGGVELIEVGNSGLFNSANNEYLTWTPSGAADDATQFVWSVWYYKAKSGVNHAIMNAADGATDQDTLDIRSTEKIRWYMHGTGHLLTTAVYRDIGWYHIVCAWDTDTGVSGTNKMRLFVNGVEVTAFDTDTNPGDDYASEAWAKADVHTIGRDEVNAASYCDGYVAECVYLDGQSLQDGDVAITDFGEFSDDGLYWTPKSSDAIKALTFGTNGFYLDFSDSSNVGADANGSVAQAYTHDGGQGDRTSSITVTMSAGLTLGAGQASNNVDGGSNDDAADGWWVTGSPAVAGEYYRYDFGSGASRIITEATFFSAGTDTNGTWKWQGSDNASDWTDIGGTFTLAGNTGGNTLSTTLSANTTGYRYYQMLGVSGNHDSQWTREIEFEIDGPLFENNNTVVTSTHTPTNIHTQLNGVWNEHFQVGSGRATITLSNGNRTGAYSVSSTEGDSGIATTLVFPNTGKFHWEWVCDSVGAHANSGLICMIVPAYQHHEDDVQGADGIVLLYHNADKTAGNTIFSEGVEELAADSDGLTATDRFSYDWDIAGGICIVKKDGSPIKTITGITVPTSPHFILFRTNAGASTRAVTWTANFEADNFVDTPAADHVALNTTNIAAATTRTVSDPYEHWANCLYDGTGAALDITIANETLNGSTFDPEFVWTKNRDQDDEHKIVDIVRGATKELNSDSNTEETTDANGVTSITSTDKYVLGTGAGGYNDSGEAFVGWAAKLGGAAASNEDGSITSSVSANTTLGMSCGTYTGTGSAATIGHGLGAIPGMVLIKDRDVNTYDWQVYHSGVGNTASLGLNITSGISTDISYWNDTDPTSSVFTVGTSIALNKVSTNYVFYAFAPSEFISIGSYTGNGSSTDGTFTPLLNSAGIPLSPIWHINKRADSTSNWYMFDKARDPYNPTENILQAAGTDVEAASDDYDHVNGGIKLRNSSASHNQSGGDYVYITIGIPVIDRAGRLLTAR